MISMIMEHHKMETIRMYNLWVIGFHPDKHRQEEAEEDKEKAKLNFMRA
jgi:hypothetical protein